MLDPQGAGLRGSSASPTANTPTLLGSWECVGGGGLNIWSPTVTLLGPAPLVFSRPEAATYSHLSPTLVPCNRISLSASRCQLSLAVPVPA